MLRIESLAVVLRNIADAVEVQVTDDREAAQRNVVADAATFTGVEGDTRHIAQRLAKCVNAPIMHQGLRNDGHRLRNIARQFATLADVGEARLIGFLAFALAGNVDLF